MKIEERIQDKIAIFNVGDNIEFYLYDASHCTEFNGDAVEIPLIGKILSINGRNASIEHKYGIANASLITAKLVP